MFIKWANHHYYWDPSLRRYHKHTNPFIVTLCWDNWTRRPSAMTIPAITISESSIYYFIFFVFTIIITSCSLRYSSLFSTHIVHFIVKGINAPISHSAIVTTSIASLTVSTSSVYAETSPLYWWWTWTALNMSTSYTLHKSLSINSYKLPPTIFILYDISFLPVGVLTWYILRMYSLY